MNVRSEANAVVRQCVWLRALCLASCFAVSAACSGDDGSQGPPGGGNGGSASSPVAGIGGAGTGGGAAGSNLGGSSSGTGSGGGGRSGGASGAPSGTFAEQIPLSETFTEVDGAIAPTDLPFVENFCGDPAVPSSLKPIGTVVRARISFRYFVCIGDLGMTSYEGMQTNEPGDPTQGFVPYAALFRYDDPANPNQDRPAKGATNYGLVVLNLLGTNANSQCGGSNATFESFKIGGALSQACNRVPSPVRDDGGNKYVDITFPGGQMQSFLLEPVPFEPPPR